MTSNDLLALSWKMLGWFTATLMFVLVVCLILAAAVICADVAVIVYHDAKRRINNKDDQH